jgi:HPt (histidine-containing phosphotransfer) domain-containing protein
MTVGNLALYKRLLADFKRNNGHFIEELRSLLGAGEITQAHRMAHTLKNVGGLIGAVQVQKSAHEVEKALSHDKAGCTEAQLEDLSQALQGVMKILGDMPELQNHESPAGNIPTGSDPAEPIPQEVMNSLRYNDLLFLFERLEPMLQKANAASLGYLNELRELAAPLGAWGDKLIGLINEYQFAEAYQTLVEIKNQLKERNDGNG